MLRANPHHERTYHDHAVHELLAERNALIRNIPELAPLATEAATNELALDPKNNGDTSEKNKAYYNASADDVKLLNEAKYKLFLEQQEQANEAYFGHDLKPRHPSIETPLHTVADNFSTPNMQDENLYRSYPIYHTPLGNSDNRLSPRDFGSVSNEEKDADLSVLEGLRAMGFEGLKRDDELRKPARDHDKEHHSSKCHCSHGFEPCCATKKKSDEEAHYYEAPVTHHYRSESHYCITGDEPYCKVLRDLRAKTTSKEEKSKVVKKAQSDVKKPVPQKEADPATRGRSKTHRSRKFEDPVPEREELRKR